MSSTFEQLVSLIARQHQLDASVMRPESGLADVGLDSLAVAELLFTIEDEFKVDLGDVPPDAVPATVSELVTLIDQKRARPA